jgi:hypothetical protein
MLGGLLMILVCACWEIARVLKPNGTAIIPDKSHTKEYDENHAMEGLTGSFF